MDREIKSEREREKVLKCPPETTAVNDEAVLGQEARLPRIGMATGVQRQVRVKRTPREGSLNITKGRWLFPTGCLFASMN